MTTTLQSRLIVAALAVLILLPGCRTFDELTAPEVEEKKEHFDASKVLEHTSTRSRLGNVAAEPAVDLEDPTIDTITEQQPIVLPSRVPEPQPATERKTYNLPMDMTSDIENADEEVVAKFNFDAAGMPEVVEMFSLTLEFQYYIDPAVSGNVSLVIDAEMTRQEVWELLEHILWISGAYASRQNGFIHVLPFAKMPKERRLFTDHNPVPNVDVSFIRLYHTAPADMASLIRPFMTDGATAQAIGHLNSLMIIEAPPNMEKIRELINRLDIMGESSWPQISIACHHVDVTEIQSELSIIMQTLGFPVVTDEKGDGHSVKIVSLERPQILLVAAPVQEVLEEVQEWVAILDQAPIASNDDERLFEYNVKYNQADGLAQAVSVFFSSVSSTATQRSSQRQSGSTGRTDSNTRLNRENQSSTPRAPTTTNQRRQSDQDVDITNVFDTPVTLYADGKHNRLLIQTTPRAYAHLLSLLKKLDTPPLQVMIQMYIVDILLDANTEFGFRYAVQNSINDYDIDVTLNPGSYLMQFGRELEAVQLINEITAVAGHSNTKVLSTPQIVVISDESATIDVGDSVPIASRFDTNDTSSTRLTDVEYIDTGTKLEVTPHITARGMVTIEMTGEVSSPKETIVSDIDSPTITTSRISTTLVVEDGATVLLGGLIRRDDLNSNSGVPGLKDIPGLGVLFKGTSKTETRRELLLLMTVKVLEIDDDFGKLVDRYQRALEMLDTEYNTARFQSQSSKSLDATQLSKAVDEDVARLIRADLTRKQVQMAEIETRHPDKSALGSHLKDEIAALQRRLDRED